MGFNLFGRIRTAASLFVGIALLLGLSPHSVAHQKLPRREIRHIDADWMSRLGVDPIYKTALEQYIKSQMSLRLPEPDKYPARDNWQPIADAGSAFVNLYRLSGDTRYRDQAKRIADWLLASN
ncbi:MAG: hypothetical protein ACREDR_11315, partial [Blastocatellia bacterium]